MTDELRLRRQGLTWREVEGEIITLDGTSSQYLAANATGAVLWNALARGTDRDELVALLTAAYDVDGATAGTDVDAFLETVRRHGLLE